MKPQLILRLLGLLLLLSTTTGQAQLAVGEWATHFSYRNVSAVAAAPDRVYAVANGKLYAYFPQENVLEEYNSLTGLNGNDIVQMAYSQSCRLLVVVYRDGNIDLLDEDGVRNLSDYKDKSIASDKTIYRLRLYGKEACLATAVGAIIIDLERCEVTSSFLFRDQQGHYLAARDFVIDGNDFYLLTSESLLKAWRYDNLSDRSYWKTMPLPSGSLPQCLSLWRDTLYAAVSGNVYRYANDTWQVCLRYPVRVDDLATPSGYLALYGGGCLLEMRTPDNKIVRFDASETLQQVVNLSIAPATNNRFMYGAAGWSGLVEWSYDSQQALYRLQTTQISPNGPAVQTAWKMFVSNEALYVAGGGRWGDRYQWPGGAMKWQHGSWTSLVPPADSIAAQTGLPFRDVLSIAIDPKDEQHLFAASWGEGLYEFLDGELRTLHNHQNSPLVSVLNNQPERYVRVDGLAYDPEGNLWVLNSDVTYGKGGVHLLNDQGEWLSPNYDDFPSSLPTWDDVLIQRNGLVWINSERVTCGLYVIDTRGSYSDFSDDRTRWISTFYDQDGRKLDFFTLHCVTEDLNGTLWIGTTFGPLLLYHPSSIFDGTPVFTRVKVPRNDGTNEADYLLENTRVYAIAVDGANRKWIGTNGDGVYLLSPDGLQTIHHFTTENSPLPSDVVYSLAVHPNTGEVFIGTEGGLVSFRGTATEGAPDYSTAHAFPNPVRPDYQGPVTITGLQVNSQVKLTDLNGNLLAAGRSLGGQFIWDACDAQGCRVASGAYLVHAIDENGQSGVVCKIMIVN